MSGSQTAELAAVLPYGTDDLDPEPHIVPGIARRVRCYVRGCEQRLRTPTRQEPGEVCPVHGIRCHYSTGGPTYSYADVRRNFIIDADFVASRIVHHPFKYESNRLGLEKSEDALTWNVFRSFQKLGCLHQITAQVTGLEIKEEPRLYLWGLSLTGDTLEPWDLLDAARKRFESKLPVQRPLTEPDIAIYLPGRYLILIEAKFTSSNPCYENGPRKDRTSLTKQELIDLYSDPELKILNYDRARPAERVPYQLWRNMIFAEWMAMLDSPYTAAFHVNLVRDGYELQSCRAFAALIRPTHLHRFSRTTWEQLHEKITPYATGPLRKYLAKKTAGLAKAFWANSPLQVDIRRM